jgi:activator of 2-hydroxyglutaryl-CoA dehydratase
MDVKQAIIEKKTSLGIELGSTRIKAVLIDKNQAYIVLITLCVFFRWTRIAPCKKFCPALNS